MVTGATEVGKPQWFFTEFTGVIYYTEYYCIDPTHTYINSNTSNNTLSNQPYSSCRIDWGYTQWSR